MPHILALLLLIFLLACSARPTHPPPPPNPPVLNLPKAQLKAGDWIISHCALKDAETCFCHRPAEKLEVKGKQEHKVIECR